MLLAAKLAEGLGFETVELQIDFEAVPHRGEFLGESAILRQPQPVRVDHYGLDGLLVRIPHEPNQVRMQGRFAAGDLLSMRSSNTNGTSVNYSYDPMNRLSTVTDNRLASGVTNYSYDALIKRMRTQALRFE